MGRGQANRHMNIHWRVAGACLSRNIQSFASFVRCKNNFTQTVLRKDCSLASAQGVRPACSQEQNYANRRGRSKQPPATLLIKRVLGEMPARAAHISGTNISWRVESTAILLRMLTPNRRSRRRPSRTPDVSWVCAYSSARLRDRRSIGTIAKTNGLTST